MMAEDVIFQMKIFLCSIFVGVVLSGSYDGWKFFWKRCEDKLALSDTFFWIVTGIALFLFTEWANKGNIRGYLFLGWICGWFVYRKVFHKILARIGNWLIGLLKKILKTVKIILERR